MEYVTEEQREYAITKAAFRVIAALDGMTLCDAIQAGERAKSIIKAAHRVNARNDEVMAFQRESQNAPLK